MVVIVTLVINILAAAFAAPLGVTNIGDLMLNAVFDAESIDGANPELNPELESGIQTELNPDAETSDVSFLEGLRLVFSFIITLLTLGFAFVNMLIQTGAPALIVLVLGLPVTFGYHMAVVSAIRGFSV